MRRVLAVIVSLGIATVLLTGVVGCAGGGSDRYDVEAVFDTAKGMVAGQQVKIAGVVAGEVTDVALAPGPRAALRLRIDPRFEPFRADATCRIVPEGLISENFVECEPGVARQPLAVGAGGRPMITVEHTTTPVSLQDVLNIFSLPTSQRVGATINELGLATAGRGEQLNAVLRRANPALEQAGRVLAVVDRQRSELAHAVRQTDAVIADLAADDQSVRTFVDRAAVVARTTAARRRVLGESVRRLPAMLDAARPRLRLLDVATRKTVPVLRAVRGAAPGLRSLTSSIPAFTRAGGPALRGLGEASAAARPAIRDARPVVTKLRQATLRLAPLSTSLDRLLVSTRDTGGVEGLSRLTYAMAILSSMYDRVSHIISAFITVPARCVAANAAHQEPKGCDHSYDGPGEGTIPINQPQCGPQTQFWFNAKCKPTATTDGLTPTLRATRRTRPGRGGRPSGGDRPGRPTAPAARPAPAPSTQPDVAQPDAITELLDYLLR